VITSTGKPGVPRVGLFRGLDSEQKAAVKHAEGPALVLAGPGTGKTRVIERRVARLIRKLGIKPDRILLLTFTRKAASEMLRRAEKFCPAARHVSGGTFHAYCFGLLQRHGGKLGYRRGFTMIEPDDAERLMRQLLKGTDIVGNGPKTIPDAATVLQILSRSANKKVSLASSLKAIAPNSAISVAQLRAIRKAYQHAKKAQQVVDYDDLLGLTVRLLKRFDSVRGTVQQQFSYLMVDEYHDTNGLQAELIGLIGGAGDPKSERNVMIVADAGQAIYGFRGARYSNVNAFIDEWSPRVLPLSVNYRSTREILAVANAIDRTKIGNRRRSLAPATDRQRGKRVSLATADTLPGEAQLIVRLILNHKKNGIPLAKQSILVRTASMGRAIETELLARRIPYRLVGGQALTEASHIKDLIAVFRAVENPRDDLALTRVLELFPKIGPAIAARMAQEVGGLDGTELIVKLRRLSRSRTPLRKELVRAFAVANSKRRLAVKVRKVGQILEPVLRRG
jgi:DNA helicase-2/ATP-dependent DNA helicase PcrA